MNRRGLLRWAVVGTLLALSAPAFAEEAKPEPIDIKNLNCESFLAQSEDIRPMLVAWVHGYSHASGSNWVLDPAVAMTFVASVQSRCEKSPKASFRYQVLETAKERQAELKKAAAKK